VPSSREDSPSTRQRIQQVALELLASAGGDDTTFREVATAAKVSPGLVYYHFGSRAQLVAAVEEAVVDALTVALSGSQHDALDRFDRFVVSDRPRAEHLRRILLVSPAVAADALAPALLSLGRTEAMGCSARSRARTGEAASRFLVAATLHFGPVLFRPLIEADCGVDAFAAPGLARWRAAEKELLGEGLFRRLNPIDEPGAMTEWAGLPEQAADDSGGAGRIRAAALELFSAEGVRPVTLRRVAQRAAVSPGLVLHHFGSKTGLVEQVSALVVERVQQALAPAPVEELGVDAVPLRLARVHELFRHDESLIGYVRRLLLDGAPEGLELFSTIMRDVRTTYAQLRAVGAMRSPADDMVHLQVVLVSLAPLLVRPFLEMCVPAQLDSDQALRRWREAQFALFAAGDDEVGSGP
jgi:AcrR family transcriptional regulator